MGFKLGQEIIDKLRGKKSSDYIPKEGCEKLISEIYWANVFRDTIQDSAWLKNKSFSPGRWAVNYVGLYVIYRILNDMKPKSVLEFGLGQSSKITTQYAKHFDAKLKIVEHNQPWIKFFEESYENVGQYIKHFELENILFCKKKSLTYKDFKQKIGDEKFDFIFVDAPYGTKYFSRPQLLDLDLSKTLEQSFAIVFDDYQRIGEQNTVEILKKKLEAAEIEFAEKIYYSDKNLCLICSKNLEYLITL